MNLVLSLIVLGGGSAAVWAGITNPEGGVWAGLGRMLRGEPEPTDGTEADVTGLLAGLSALAAIGKDARREAASNPRRRRRRRTGGGGGGGGGGGVFDDTSGSAGARAVAFAAKQIGDPYKWGAMGPDAWDCSGLTQAAWRAAGVSIPRTTTFQQTIGTNVKDGPFQPGDLIFPTAGHVQLYAGGGQVIEAPRTGLKVRRVPMPPISSLWAARRPHKGA